MPGPRRLSAAATALTDGSSEACPVRLTARSRQITYVPRPMGGTSVPYGTTSMRW